ncbi:hypothetical protein GQ53DRAFT_744284 [Thozetella sp. PMI_491]|nr:hypothetical protein GQ53DRAFT_744284 [Thozetella sp. PMI_491]
MFETRRQDMDPVKKGDRAASAVGRTGLDMAPKMRPITPPREMSPRRDGAHRDIEFEAREEITQRTAAQKPIPKPKPQTIAQLVEGPAAADSAAMGGVNPRRATKVLEEGDMGPRKVERLISKPKPVLDEPPALSPLSERTSFDVGREGSSWPLPTPRPPVPKPKPQAKAPAAVSQSSARVPGSPSTGRGNGEGRHERQPLAPAVSTKPKPQPPTNQSLRTQQDRAVTPPQQVRRAMTELRSPQPQRIVPNPILDHPALPQRTSSIKAGTRRDEQTRPTPAREPEPRPTSRDSISSDDTFVSASSTQSPRPSSPVRAHDQPAPDTQRPRPSASQAPLKPPILNRASSISATSSNSPHRIYRSSTASLSPNTSGILALESLTSAMMASNLAASRSAANTPSRNSPVPPPPRRQNRHSPLHASNTGGSPNRNKGGAGGTKSPGRMLQTLRAPTSLSDDEDARRRADRYRKKHLTGSKKHAHHEGSRRRWRDEVTAKERRRYEAVWASNRGLFLDRAQLEAFRLQHGAPRLEDQGLAPEELVVNVVVRDIWSRSRLPVDELAEVWDLVDRSRIGALSKHEFVVGMWLIDQRLRGRKIPASVGSSVWESARDMKFSKPEKGGKRR